MEVQQNNELLGAQARATRVILRQADNTLVMENPELAGTLFKYRENQILTDYEQMLLDHFRNFRLVNYQNVYREMREGLIDPETIPLEGWRLEFRPERDQETLSMLDYWNRRGDSEFDPDFVQWMEENVVDR